MEKRQLQTYDKSISILFKQNKGQIVELHFKYTQNKFDKQGLKLD